MIIQNFHTDYVVISQRTSTPLRDIYICKSCEEKKGQLYTLIKLNDIRYVEALIHFFQQEVSKAKLKDYVEQFTFEGNIYFVFRYSNENLLLDKLDAERCSFEERLVIVKNILERMLLLDMPPALQCDCLALSQITVAGSLDIGFNYEFNLIDKFQELNVADVGRSLIQVLSVLFEKELKRESCPEIKELQEWLRKGNYEDYAGIFYEYMRNYELLLNQPEAEVEKSQTFLFRLWEKIKAAAVSLKKVLIAVLMIAALLYLGNTVIEMFQEPAKIQSFSRIGTIEIRK